MTTRIGLVSDTHMPMRLRELPAALFEALHDVDLVLHAGDVGDLTVLDELSVIAPVVAVHGNDDSADARHSLPYQTIVTCPGARILLWHSHHEDRQEEFASRQGEAFLPKLRRISAQAADAGATLAVFGHWHIPLFRQVDGVTVINPGAVASGNVISRQLKQTVAKLEIQDEVNHTVRHIDLADPQNVYEPFVDWDAGFRAALDCYSESILSPELQERLPSFLGLISETEQEMLQPPFHRLAQRCWDGEFDRIDSALLRTELLKEPSLSPKQKERYAVLLE